MVPELCSAVVGRRVDWQCGGLVRDLCFQIPGDELAVPGCTGGAPPFPAGSGWPQAGSRLENYIPAFGFVFLKKKQQQKQAENKNLTRAGKNSVLEKGSLCLFLNLAFKEPGCS